MLFTQELLSKGEKGGEEAAIILSNELRMYTSDNLGHLESPKLIVRIYADFTTLAETLLKVKMIDQASTFDDFARGFNSAKVLFDFVDTGSKRELSKGKITELLKLHVYDCHCHQVLLGCSHNDDFVPVLEDFRNDEQARDHITLLEGVPFAKGLSSFQSHFKTIQFADIFQNTKPCPPPPASKPPPTVHAVLPALTRVESNKTTGTTSSTGTPQMNWATVTAQAHTPVANGKVSGSRTSTPSSTTTAESIKAKSTKSIDKNRSGMRIDRVDASIPNYEIQRVKKLKLCNIYYLQGPTLCTSAHCTHRHDYPISNYERKILREVARMTPCYYKTDCDDAECIYGHRCPQSKPNEQACYYGEDCRFFGWGHGIDTRVVKTIKV
jgi:hypothetical protein